MQFPSIDIQGSVLSADLLGTIRTEQAEHQSGKSFHPDYTNSKLKEEISLAWQDAKGQWAIFQSKLKRVREGETATTETRNFWIIPLLSNLGYNLNYSREAEVLAGKSFPISYKDATNQFPVHVCGFNESLDKRPESKQLRVSPHALLQEYLNYSEQLYGVVTNGRQLRLLRDASRLTRLSYVEFNLEKMMEEDLYSDFVILYRLLHVSRMRAATSGSDQAIMELYHQQSLAAGATIREKLGDAVKQVILDLANGLVNHPDNIAFRQLIVDNLELLKNGKPARFDNDEFYRQLLRVVYRMLFLFVIEERNLVYAESRQPEVKRLSNIYFRYYSLMRLRKLARHLPPPDASRHNDLWLSLLSTFALFEHQHTGSKMGIMALQGDLFAYNAIVATHYDMHQMHLSNQAVLKMLRMLSYFENDQRVLVAVNYGGLDVEEFGSVYEGLLELKIKIDTRPGSDELICDFDRSNERSKSGSHYTPEELVQPLIKHSLDYLIEDRVNGVIGEERVVIGDGKLVNGDGRMVNGDGRLVNGDKKVVKGDWGVVSGKYPALRGKLSNLIVNLCIEYDIELQRTGSMEKGYGFSGNGIPINQLLSKRRIVWDDFSTPQSGSINTRKRSRRLGTEWQERVSSVFADSQRQPEGTGNTSGTGSTDRIDNRTDTATTGGTNSGVGQAAVPIATSDLSEAQYQLIWHALPEKLRYSLFTTHHLLALKICDVACGSGHILLSAARRVAMEIARIQTDEEQPNPLATRKALREVIRHCIYGVDKNPLAIELCKIAFWLEAHNPGEPLNFLDHHIKCGDAIVGLAHKEELQKPIATEAFNSLSSFTDEEKKVAVTLRKQNDLEKMGVAELDFYARVEEPIEDMAKLFAAFEALPENTPEEIEAKEKAYKKLTSGANWWRLKTLADIQVAQFFLRKTPASKDRLTTTATYQQYLKGQKSMQGDLRVSDAITIANEKRFFHWFLEFPEVFQKGGFDCILGNPPFLGGGKISTNFSHNYLEFLKTHFHPIGAVDLATYFFRRIFGVIRENGFQALISTNTIAQGSAREGGLEVIIQHRGIINFAIKSIKWPGIAAVEVSLIVLGKNLANTKKFLNGIEVVNISSYLDDTDFNSKPEILFYNVGRSSEGVKILGIGFILEKSEADKLIIDEPQCTSVIRPLMNGDDLVNDPYQQPSRFIIDFRDWQEEYCKETYPICYRVIEQRVKPVRMLDNRESYRKYWWQFAEKRATFQKIRKVAASLLAVNNNSRHYALTRVNREVVYSHSLTNFAIDADYWITILMSTIAEAWAWWQGSTLGSSTLRYTSVNIFQTFPFPQNNSKSSEVFFETVGEAYHEHRKQLMLAMQLGLTKTYNLFHSDAIRTNGLTQKDKQVAALQKHLEKTPGTIPFAEAIDGILKLRELHVEMDNAVLEAYGWQDIQLRHDFYEVDYLPENDRTRYTIHPDARKEVLKRLLELNHKIRKEEEDQGLWGGKGSTGKPTKPKGGGKTGGGKSKPKHENQSELF